MNPEYGGTSPQNAHLCPISPTAPQWGSLHLTPLGCPVKQSDHAARITRTSKAREDPPKGGTSIVVCYRRPPSTIHRTPFFRCTHCRAFGARITPRRNSQGGPNKGQGARRHTQQAKPSNLPTSAAEFTRNGPRRGVPCVSFLPGVALIYREHREQTRKTHVTH